MQKRLTFFLLLCTAKSFAQIPEDAIRYSWYQQNGTARAMAFGGAVGSLGGDATSTFVNPAGIGFYKTNESAITPGFNLNNIKTDFRKSTLSEKNNAFSLGTSGFVFAIPNKHNENNSKAFAIAFTQKVNYNNILHYKGLNNYSSYSEVFAEEFANSKQSIDQMLGSYSSAPFTAAPALFTYLIDTVTIGGKTIIKAAPEYIIKDLGQAIQQEMTKTTKGGLYELGATFAGNNGDKLLWGVGIGIPILNYQSNTTFSENDTSSSTTNHFKSFTFKDNYTTKGIGFNAKLGIIYRPKERIRLGLAVHTPSFMSLTDSRQSNMQTALENPIATFAVSSDIFTNGQKGEAKYLQNMPWKVIVSGSYVFKEIEDVKKQRGFITADIEYVKHSGSKFKSNNDSVSANEFTYYKELNSVIKQLYKGNINLKLGGELKFNTIMARIGFGYYGNPYKDAPSKANKMTISGGLGYRHKGIFVDLTYVHLLTKDFDVPYRLQNAQTVYSDVKSKSGNIMATIGMKF